MKTIALRRQFAKYCIYIVSFWGRLYYRGLEDPKTIFGSSRKLLLHRLCNLRLHRHFWIYSFGFVNTVSLSNFYRLIWCLIRFASINPRYSPHHSGGFRVFQTWGSLFYLVFRYRPRIAGPWLELAQDSHSSSPFLVPRTGLHNRITRPDYTIGLTGLHWIEIGFALLDHWIYLVTVFEDIWYVWFEFWTPHCTEELQSWRQR